MPRGKESTMTEQDAAFEAWWKAATADLHKAESLCRAAWAAALAQPARNGHDCDRLEAVAQQMAEALEFGATECACPDATSELSTPAVAGHASSEGCCCPCHTLSKALTSYRLLTPQEPRDA